MENLINTVPAENQMRHSDEISFLGDPEAPWRILILGNSITRHGPSSEIGWHWDWGMAASAPEKDYVHRLFAKLKARGKEPYMMIRQASHWERNFNDPDCLLRYEAERAFGAHTVIFRLGENVSKNDYSTLSKAAKDLVSFVAPRSASVIFTTNFWKNTACDDAIGKTARELNAVCVDIGCTDESMMALGKFAHRGVSIHPGDEGMEMIAEKIFHALT